MAPADLAHEADQLIRNQDYEKAIDLLTQAIHALPAAAPFYIKRSTAYQRNQQYHESLLDAEQAVFLARERGKKPELVSAQLRRGIALFLLGRILDAGWCFTKVQQMDGNEKTAPIWMSKVHAAMDKTEGADLEVSIVEIPAPNQPWHADAPAPKEPKIVELPAEPAKTDKQRSATTPAPPQPGPAPVAVIGSTTPREKIRHEWYQSSGFVVFTLFAKSVPAEKSKVDIQTQSLTISFPLADGSNFCKTFEPLAFEIIPQSSQYQILGTKVELHLAKKVQGTHWPSFETGAVPVPTHAPKYPTSSRSGPKDWTKVTSELLTKEDEKPADELNDFFQTIFKDADEDTRRAMIKSYTESNGTALSTNWEEVRKAKVETSPPTGMEARKYDA